MKNFRFLVFLFCIAGIFSSCTMEKRLYRKGFYVDRIKKETKSGEQLSREFVSSPSQNVMANSVQTEKKEKAPVRITFVPSRLRGKIPMEKIRVQAEQPDKLKFQSIEAPRGKIIPGLTKKPSGKPQMRGGGPSAQQPILFGFAFLAIGALVLIFNPEGIFLAVILLGVSALLFLFALILWLVSNSRSTKTYS